MGHWHQLLLVLAVACPSVHEEYQGGEVLDPENRKIYRTKMKFETAARPCTSRGFIGISLLGRTQVWMREECGLGGSLTTTRIVRYS